MEPLPIDSAIPGLVADLERAGALVLVAPPGAGKTTRLPPALLGGGKVLVSQPRRLAAQATAARIAEERGVSLGDEVGYRVRFESRRSASTRLEVVTEGLLLRQLVQDPSLDGVSTVVLDEFHERSVQVDLLLGMLQEVRASLRPELRLVIMSATIDPEPIAAYLGDAPIHALPERPHPVELRHVDLVEDEPLARRVAVHLARAWRETSGHALVFLPGLAEIRACQRELEGFARDAELDLVPLHGGLGLDEQRRALRPTQRRRVLLSTNVAETSLTVEGVDLVIDSGWRRRLRQDVRSGLDRLVTERVSRHSADQRAGRAGRTGPGLAIRLWPRVEHQHLPVSDPPELHAVGLESVCLELHAWGLRDPSRFPFLDRPSDARLEAARHLLRRLGTIDAAGELSAQGRFQAETPCHPRLSRLLWTCARAGRPREGALLAALLEERELRSRNGPPAPAESSGPSDLLRELDVLEAAERKRDSAAWARREGLRPELLRRIRRVAQDLERRARGQAGPAQPGDEALLKAVLDAYPDRVVRRRPGEDGRGRMVGGKGVRLSEQSVVREHEFFVAVELADGPRGRDAWVRRASGVQLEWLLEREEARHERRECLFDPSLERVRATSTRCFHDLPIEEPREVPVDPDEARPLLEAALLDRVESMFSASRNAGALLARLRFLARTAPELELPALGPQELAALVARQLDPTASLRRSDGLDLVGTLRRSLPHAVAASLDDWVPETIAVPSGSRLRVDYDGERAVLGVRVQELFGSTRTPCVLRGRVPVLLHLLGPNGRPVQITDDLAGFWTRTYPQVRKDLRARYPKHAWPEDPQQATAERRPRRRRS